MPAAILAVGLWAGLSFPAVGASPDASAQGPCVPSGWAEAVLRQPFPGDTLRLPHRVIAAESFELWADRTRFLPDRDFELLPLPGLLVWRGLPPPAAIPLVARYHYLPLPLTGEWRRELVADSGDTLALALGPRAAPTVLPGGARLEFGGSKTFAVEFGNRRDLSLQQSLDLTVRGQLAEQVQVRAILTDRRTPLQPEGTTAELSDLDQILLEVQSPWGGLRLGDIAVRETGFRFIAHQREMEGLLANGRLQDRHQANAAIGRGLGDLHTLQRFGEDGKQGPYPLLGGIPGEQAVIVAGSERVWLDGARLQRGQDADYVIEYGTGELWFTVRRPITSVSEIRVDYQVRQGAFDREYYALGAASGDSTAGLGVAWFRERDNPERSPLYSLNDEERAALAAAGDSVTAALAGGVLAVPPGEGDYEAVEVDTLDAPFFVYVGPADPDDPRRPGGSYQVTFADVGAGRGDYADSTIADGETIYNFVGPGRGRFLPGRSLSLPQSLDVVAVRSGAVLGAGLALHGEGALSWRDGNILSPRDDVDNAGQAFRLGGDWRLGSLGGGPAERVVLRFHWQRVSPRFVAPEPLDVAFYHRRWNASSARVLDGRDRRGSVGLTLRPGDRILIDVDWESLRARELFRGERWHARVERRGRLSVVGEAWRASSQEAGEPRRSLQQRAAVSWRGRGELSAQYEAEQLDNGTPDAQDGEGYHSGTLQAVLPDLLPGLRASVMTRVRWERTWEAGQSQPAGRRRLHQIELEYARAPTTAELLYARRVTEDTGARGEQSSDLVDWVLSWLAPQALLQGEWRGQVTTAEERQRIGKLIEVGPHAGHYDSLGNYVGRGDYDFYYVRGDSAALETHLETAARWTLRPFVRAAGGASPLRGLESLFYGRIEVATEEPLTRLLGSARRIFGWAAPTRLHERVLRTELAWRSGTHLPAPRLRLEESVRRERSSGDYGRARRLRSAELELRWTMRPGLTTRGQAGLELEREGIIRRTAAEEPTDELRTRQGGAEVTWKIFYPFSLRSGWTVRRERFRPAEARRTLGRMTAALIAEFRRAARAEMEIERRWSDGTLSEGLPFLVERPGWRLTLTGSIRPRGGVTGSLRLQVAQDEGRDAVTNGRMEVRAFF